MKNILKQRTIGFNPLEDYLSNAKDISATQQQISPEQLESLPVKKQRVTIHVPIELIEKVKNAVYWEPGLTLAGFAEQALAQALDNLEQERGAPFPDRRDKRLKGGRPIK
jgi:hypothetical protein